MAAKAKRKKRIQPRDVGAINWVGLGTLIKREIERFITTMYLQTLVAPIVTTLLFYAIFALAFGGAERVVGDVPFLEFLAPGLIMMGMVQNAFANTSFSLVMAKVQGTIIDFLMPPLSSAELMVGFIVGGLVRGLMVGAVTGLALSFFVSMEPVSWGLVLVFAFLGNFMLAALGVVTGIWADKFDNMATITNFVITPLTFLSGTFYSVNSLPEIWRAIAYYNPFFYMIDGFRAAFIGQADASVETGIIVLLSINILLVVMILYMFKIGYKIKS